MIDKAIFDPQTDQDIPPELVALRVIAAGHDPKTDTQVRMKRFMEDDFKGFMKMKMELEDKYLQQRRARDGHDEATDAGTAAALKVAKAWLERHGVKQE